jgi:hypothetical protein
MSMLGAVGLILASGALGGIVNALVSDNGFIKPSEEIAEDMVIVRPGFAGNIVLGAIAAFISWGLYGAFANSIVYGPAPNGSGEITISLSALAGALLVGIGGARWLTNEVDKKLLRSAAAYAARSGASTEEAKRISRASPIQAFNIARKMHQK